MESIICPNCKSPNTGESKFCQVCGSPLSNAGEQPAATPPPDQSDAVTLVPPPIPAAQVPPAVHSVTGTPVSKLGVWVDGWSDVIEGAAGYADEVKAEFIQEMQDAGVVGLRSAESLMSSGTSLPQARQIIQSSSGASVVVNIAPYGKGLRVGWDLYTRRSPNWVTIGVLGGVILFFALLTSIHSFQYDSALGGLISFFSVITGWPLVPIIGLMIAGKICKEDIWAFFVKDPDDFALEDAESLGMVVDSALSNAILDALEEDEVEEE